jgi:hypothetical protein
MSLHTNVFNWTVDEKKKYILDDSGGEEEEENEDVPEVASASDSKSSSKVKPPAGENVEDLYETNEECIRCIPFFLRLLDDYKSFEHIVEPFCGKGAIVDYLTGEGFSVTGTDKQHYGKSVDVLSEDFIIDKSDVIVTKPPFVNQEVFVKKMLSFKVPCILLLPLSIMGMEYFHTLPFNATVTVSNPAPCFSRNGKEMEHTHGTCAWFFFNFPPSGMLSGVLHYNCETGMCGTKGKNNDVKSPDKTKSTSAVSVSPVKKIDYGVDMAGYIPCSVCKPCSKCNDSSCDVCLTCDNCDGSGRVCE